MLFEKVTLQSKINQIDYKMQVFIIFFIFNR